MPASDQRRILLTTDAVGGVWQYSLGLARGLERHGWRAILAMVGPAPSTEQVRQADELDLITTGLPLDWLSDGAEPVERAAQELAGLTERLGADLVHCNTPALVAAAAWPVPVVAAAHGCVATWWREVRSTPLDPSFHWHREMVRRGLLVADAVICPSRAFSANVRQTYDLPFTPQAVWNGRSTGVSPSNALAPHALTVGRLWDEAKNAAVLDRAASMTDTPIIAVGALGGPHGEAFAPQQLHGLGSLGEAELAGLLADRPIFVSAALFEPFGLAVLEAASAGCALVLSDIPTFRELWDDAALFVDARDAAGFAQAIDTLAERPAFRQELGRQAKQRAARYTPESSVAATAAVYDRLLAAREVAA